MRWAPALLRIASRGICARSISESHPAGTEPRSRGLHPTLAKIPIKVADRRAVKVTFQFSLRQVLLAATLLAVCLGTGKWYYIKYIDRTVPITTEGDLDRCNGLDSYLGKRVSLCGRYQCIPGASPYQVVWFGNQPIALLGVCANGSPLSPTHDGALITVTGRLARAPADVTPLATIERRTWCDERSMFHETCVQQVIVYCINVREVSVGRVESDSDDSGDTNRL